jgi:uncharacterized NAD(P)/FAD-binding protein YdhS
MLGSTRIGIVGAGASAVCLLDALSRRDAVPAAVTVFDPAPHPWRGRAYQPDSEVLRVNAPPEDMSVRAGDPRHFLRWLEERRAALGMSGDYADARSGIVFPPRAVYGDYLEQSARSALGALADRGSDLSFVRSAVTGLRRDGQLLVAGTADGGSHVFDHVVLCMGNSGPADPHRLGGAPGFVPDPYPVARRLAEIGPRAGVVVVGSGLSAVDVVLSLAAAGHEGGVVLASRTGILPGVRQRQVEHVARYFTAEHFRATAARGQTLTLADASALMRKELTAAGADPDAVVREISTGPGEDPQARLRRGLAAVDDPDLGLRILQRAVPDTGPDVWQLLPERDRAALVRHHYRTIMSLCCPMPPATAEALLRQAGEGRLEFARLVGRISPVPGGGFRLWTEDGVRHADVVVNAVSPPAHRIPPAAQPLVASLVGQGLAERHPRGGLRVTRATSGLTVKGRADTRLYALGDLASGSLFFTFGVPSLVDRAVDIADAIHREAARRAVSMQTA